MRAYTIGVQRGLASLLALVLLAACSGGGGGGRERSGAKAITSFSFQSPPATGTIDEGAKTIAVTVPFATDCSALVATFTTTGASVRVGANVQVSGSTPNDFSTPRTYVVTAADGTTASYTVTVTVAPATAKAITAFSFSSPPVMGVIDEGAKTITVAVPYGTDVGGLVATFTSTGVRVDVGSVEQVSGVTVNSFKDPVLYTVTAADASTATYTVTVTAVANPAKAITAFALDKAVGTIDEGAKTIAVPVPYGTDVTALVATFTTTGASVTVGGTLQESGRTVNDFTSPVEYVVTAEDGTSAVYTVTVTVAINPDTRISAVSFATPGAMGTIDDGAGTIAVTVPYGTDVTALVASFTTAGSVTVGGTPQVSGATANDFTSPVSYVVTSGGSIMTYTVTVSVAPISAKAITSFEFASLSATGVIDEATKTITVAVPYGTDVTALVATFTTTGASVKVGTTVQVSGTTPNDFTSPVAYVVTAADASTATYVVTIPPTVGVVQGLVTLPSPATNRCYEVFLSTNPASGVAVASVTGVVNGTSISYSLVDVPPGTYFLAAGVDNDQSSASPPLCTFSGIPMPTHGDFIGFFGGSMFPPPSANVAVSPGITTTKDFSLTVY